MKRVYDVTWLLLLSGILVFLLNDDGRSLFVSLTSNHPVLMGFIKFAILATMGEFLVRRITKGEWAFKGTRLCQRALVWGFLGILFTYVFPIYSSGIDFLVSKKMLPIFEAGFLSVISIAFWKSTWMNMLFAFPMMSFHRITDTLIDRKKLFSKWPFLQVWNSIDWNNMWKIVAPTILWFWIPAHTITFCLPPEFRIIMAAGLSICLGAILAFAKSKAK